MWLPMSYNYILIFDVIDMLLDGGLTNEDIKDLCFEALKEIIPDSGLKGSVLRSRIWKVICEVQ